MRRFGLSVPLALLVLTAACSGDGDEAAPTPTRSSPSRPAAPAITGENLSLVCDGTQTFPQAAAYAGSEHPMHWNRRDDRRTPWAGRA